MSKRKSNIELYRIIVMIAIIAHHYVVNSGLIDSKGPIYSNIGSWRSAFLLIFGAWGKIGINCFVLITGYYMCKSQITLKKFVKLIAEVTFYKMIISIIFAIAGYDSFSLIKTVFQWLPITSIANNFTGCYLAFYLSIPFINILINGMRKGQHRKLLALLSFIYILFGTFNLWIIEVKMNYFSWFIVIYLIGAYLRNYPEDFEKLRNRWGIIAGTVIMISAFSVLLSIRLFNSPYFFVTDSNTFLAVITSICVFMFFLNIDIKHSEITNKIASTTFGILLIHANSNSMRQWLWVDMFDNVGTYSKSMMPIRAIGTVIIVFFVCSAIDLIRQRFIEKPFMKLVESKINS